MSASSKGSGLTEGTLLAAPAEAFFRWLAQETSADSVDFLLFFGHMGQKLERMAFAAERSVIRSAHVPMSSAAILLASMELATFVDQLPSFLSLGEGLTLSEWFKDLEIPLPAVKFISDIGLGPDTLIERANADLLTRFLYAYRWEIFKVCRKKRRELFLRYLETGIKDGMRIGIVDIGWETHPQLALGHVLNSTFGVQTYGYSFCSGDDSASMEVVHAVPRRVMIATEVVSDSVRAGCLRRSEIEERFFEPASAAALAGRV